MGGYLHATFRVQRCNRVHRGGISRLKHGIENRISTITGDYKTRFEKIEAAIEDLDKQLTRLEEKHKRILKEEEEEEEEDYEEDDW